MYPGLALAVVVARELLLARTVSWNCGHSCSIESEAGGGWTPGRAG